MNEKLCEKNKLKQEDFTPKTPVVTEERIEIIEGAIVEIAEVISEIAEGMSGD